MNTAVLSGAALASIFLALSSLHWYWVVAGSGKVSSVVPEVDGKPAFQPGPISTSAVAVLLLVAAVVCAAQAELLGLPRSTLSRTAVWGILVAFLLRAVGEFRLVGFFKRVRNTRFARMDSWVYSPLCVAISILSAVLLQSSR